MGLKVLKPTTPTRRHTVLLDYAEVTAKEPYKALTKKLKYHAGRNARGKKTVRHKGGRAKRKFRILDFARDKYDIVARVESIEYDPNRSANIALLKYADGERRYILAPEGLEVGAEVMSGENVPVKLGNAMPLKKIPAASFVHNVELDRGKGGIIGRSAGTSIQIQGSNKNYVQLKMPSGEVRLVKGDCYATLGIIGNGDLRNVKIGKAGRNRKKGIRPTVRGVAQSSSDHPHAHGQGKSGRHGPGGPAKDPWGNKVGKRTRTNKKSNKYIISRRPNVSKRKFKKFKTVV